MLSRSGRALFFRGLAMLAAAFFAQRAAAFFAQRAANAQPPTVDDIVAGLTRQDELLFGAESMDLRYERTGVRDVIANSLFAKVLRAEWRVSYLQDNWLVERRFTESSPTEKVHVPAGKEINLCRGPVLLEWGEEMASAFVEHFDIGRNSYQGLYYFEQAGFDAPRRIAAAGGAKDRLDAIRAKYPDQAGLPFLPEFLESSKSNYQVSPAVESVAGVKTWVIEWPGVDKIWVDASRDFTVVRRAFTWGPDKPLRMEIEGSDFREVRPGLWLPFKQVVQKYASLHDPRDVWGKVVTMHEYRVHECAFDTLDASAFEVSLPVGTRVLDSVRKMRYTVSGDDTKDPFSEAIALARQQLDERRSAWWKWVVLAAVLGGLTLFVCSRLLRRKPKAGK